MALKPQPLGAVLCFQNAEREEDCLIGFLDTPWHTHDNLVFAGGRGYYIELNYLDLLTGLREGRVLVCEREVDGRTVDRWLIHSEYNDEFKYLEDDERIIVRRAAIRQAVPGSDRRCCLSGSHVSEGGSGGEADEKHSAGDRGM